MPLFRTLEISKVRNRESHYQKVLSQNIMWRTDRSFRIILKQWSLMCYVVRYGYQRSILTNSWRILNHKQMLTISPERTNRRDQKASIF